MESEVRRLDGGRLSVTVDGETIGASVEFWQALLFSVAVRDRLQANIIAGQPAPTIGPEWWNGREP